MNEFVTWSWDSDKNESNREKHGLSLAAGLRVFDDPLATTSEDPFPFETRFRTVGIDDNTLMMVIHTAPAADAVTGMWVGRIISVRKATPQERRDYEER